MTDTRVPSRVFPRAKQEADRAKGGLSTPQTQDPAYRLAFQDMDFLLREDLRPVRFQLELLKPELVIDEAGIASTFVMYGSARIPAPDKAQAVLDAATDDASRKIAERLVAKSKYYEVARELGRLASSFPVDTDGQRHFVVCSGGGPSIMEAANRGACDVGAESIGLNIVLPHEQAPNPYVTPRLSLQFHYFALRKMHFLLHARALAAFPGGFGTFDELFELLTLIQTGKIQPIPVLLYGKEFWQRVVNFEALVEEGVVSPKDLDIFTYCETAEEGWECVQRFYQDRSLDAGLAEAEQHAAEEIAAQADTSR
ncbi:TIGR00730 family Rossman fold protein [Sphingomonas asaccharolytica]|uniref:LOG family protein n=1 Tax=Sphingomonas asaccharolytica TaxID=40681 RepID=UPI00082DC459|nr:TIGR00730 family Rossman fold protein [Sphingomonas asaccharolytica]